MKFRRQFWQTNQLVIGYIIKIEKYSLPESAFHKIYC